MYRLKTVSSFDGAHFLYEYEGKCKNIHGHRWQVAAEVYGENLDTTPQTRGMLVDFSSFKSDLKKLTDEFDHSLIVEKGSLMDKTMEALTEEGFKIIILEVRPTAENLARIFYDRLCNMGYKVYEMTVYETPENCATYKKEDCING